MDQCDAMFWEAGREFKGKIDEIQPTSEGLRIKLSLKVTFIFGSEKGETRRRKTQHAEFLWSPSMTRARLDPTTSDLTKQEFEELYGSVGVEEAKLRQYSR